MDSNTFRQVLVPRVTYVEIADGPNPTRVKSKIYKDPNLDLSAIAEIFGIEVDVGALAQEKRDLEKDRADAGGYSPCKNTPFKSLSSQNPAKRTRLEERAPVQGKVYQDQLLLEVVGLASNPVLISVCDHLNHRTPQELEDTQIPVYADGQPAVSSYKGQQDGEFLNTHFHVHAIVRDINGRPLVPLHDGPLPEHWSHLQSLHNPQDGIITSVRAQVKPVETELEAKHGDSLRFQILLVLETHLLANFFDSRNNFPYAATSIEKRASILRIMAQRDAQRRHQLIERGFLAEDDMPSPIDSLFYHNLDPAPATASPKILKPHGLASTLYPFQSRSVMWMLHREGVTVDLDQLSPEGYHKSRQLTAEEAEPLLYDPFCDKCCFVDDSPPIWANLCTGQAWLERPKALNGQGLLSDEMGLGKTLDVLSLILLHPEKDRSSLPRYQDDNTFATVFPSHLTLIVCHSAIFQQWREEIEKHAPSLRILVYRGLKQLDNKTTTASVIRNYDVVLCSFEIMSKEVVYARKPPDRSLRSGKRGDYRRSLLIEIDFLRVVIDEVQMLTSSSQASETASCIPRKYSFAVSGTPVKQSLPDLRGPMKFLGFSRLADVKPAFSNFLSERELDTFLRVFHTIGIRTTKRLVSHEMHLPRQHRFVVPLTYGDIERASYRGRYLEAIADLGLDAEAVDPDFSIPKMMSWLTRLRQVCFHSQVGGGAAMAAKFRGAVQTLDEVLADMQDEATAEFFTARRNCYNAMIKAAHLTSRDRENCEGLEESLPMFQQVIKSLERLRATLARLAKEQRDVTRNTSSSESDTEQAETISTKKRRINDLKTRHRDCMTLLHTAHFFSGNVYATMGNKPDEEDRAYEKAEAIRKSILAPQQAGIAKAIQKMQTYFEECDTEITDLEIPFTNTKPGIQTATIFEGIEATSDTLNETAELLWDWREQLCRSLAEPIIALKEDQEASPDTYEKDAEAQELLEVRLDQFKSLLGDWREHLTGERSWNADHLVSASASLHRIRAEAAAQVDNIDSKGLQLFAMMDVQRKNLLRERVVPLRAFVKDLHDVTQGIRVRPEEVEIAMEEGKRLRKLIRQGEDLFESLDNELRTIMMPCFNSRAGYFVQLQNFSDAVADVDLKRKSFQEEIKRYTAEQQAFARDAELKQRKRTYLEFLSSEQKNATAEERICAICADHFSQGLLTHCAHVFCAQCLTKWLVRSRSCPICKEPCQAGSYIRVNVKKVDMPVNIANNPTTGMNGGLIHPSGLETTVNLSLASDMDDIIERGARQNKLGVKLDTVVQHIKAMRDTDPNAKAVLFSAWTEALRLCCNVFDATGIGYVTLDKSRKNSMDAAQLFQHNTDVAVFILHSQSQAAGLTLTAAKTIIMIEPLLNPALELQIVGRIHRIGQASETAVYQYIIKDTVDERIATRNARQGHPLFLADRELTAEHAVKEEEHEADFDISMTDADMPAPAPSRTNAEETITSDNLAEDLAALLLEKEEYHNLQQALFRAAHQVANGLEGQN